MLQNLKIRARIGGVAQSNMVLDFTIDGTGKATINLKDMPEIFKSYSIFANAVNKDILQKAVNFIVTSNPTNTNQKIFADYMTNKSLQDIKNDRARVGRNKVSDKLKNLWRLAACVKEFEQACTNRNSFKLSELPDGEKFEFDETEQTMREFFVEQFEKNLRKMYKLKNNTLTSEQLEEVLKQTKQPPTKQKGKK